MEKAVVSVVGIRPDFIRMSAIFKKLDARFNHILVHTGQHYNKLLSDVFFDELKIRKPDYNLGVGGKDKEHFHQSADCSVKLIELIRRENLDPGVILFLGDSNSVSTSVALRKEGYKIGHIEAGMRSYDKRMLEEINRVVCDHCSDLLFVYHKDYAEQLRKENITKGVYVVGNTIVEVCLPFAKELMKIPRRKDQILVDIHRPENFKYSKRLRNIVDLAKLMGAQLNLPVKWLLFPRTYYYLQKFGISLKGMELKELLPYKKFLEEQYHSLVLLSDSGTSQEEPALLNTPVIVPRDFTERPQSMLNNCSILVDVNEEGDKHNLYKDVFWWLRDIELGSKKIDSSWLGDGNTSERIVSILEECLA